MTKPTFLKYDKPLLTVMVQAYTPERVEELIEASLPEGAEAFGMQFCKFDEQYRNEEVYKRLFAAAKGKPVYVTNYRKAKRNDASFDQLAEELLTLAECGATLCDVMGGYYDVENEEFSTDSVAVEKQMKLIERLHKAGAEVLMSSHICKFTPAERVMEVALEHKRRGADICKIVTAASTMEEQIENLRILNMLKENLGIPFLYLSGGEESYISRRLGGALGNCMSLCVYEQDEFSTKAQPDLRDLKLLRDTLGL
jgi:3-dehydroquinate dehydratase type I